MATICQCPEEYDDTSALCHVHNEDDLTFRENRHSKCDQRRIDQTIGLQILQTCRQIHHEAALLPFASNRFVINDVSSFWRDPDTSSASTRAYPKQRLGRAQTKAITHLIFDKRLYGWNSDVADKVWSQLTGVKVLELVLHTELARQYMPLRTPMEELLVNSLCPPRLNLLAQLNLSAVYVGLYLRVFNVTHKLEPLDVRRLVERAWSWQRETERKILAMRDHSAAEETLRVVEDRKSVV